MSSAFGLRRATPGDAATIARHRVAMFRDMGRLAADTAEPLERASEAWLRRALADGEYLGWLAAPAGDPATIVAGAGVQVRRVLPFPHTRADGSVDTCEGRQAIVVNVYTEPGFRRMGLARRLMEAVLDWARAQRLESLVLHAAPDGRPLYEALGFAATNEMRFAGDLHPPVPPEA
ncbi:MAG TPA: GNAT family N-acetyltransferase [Gemmatimonadales bacterium]|nr:GNAT family N-acetyltransferase [Gemmatimonadales bacterium]